MAPRNVISGSKGYTLIEVLVALAILAVVATALLKSSLLVIQQNMQAEVRDEAVRLGEQRMNELRSNSMGFNPVSCPTASHIDLCVEDFTFPAVPRKIRGGSVGYSIFKRVTQLDTGTKQVVLTVTWTVKDSSYSHSIASIVRR